MPSIQACEKEKVKKGKNMGKKATFVLCTIITIGTLSLSGAQTDPIRFQDEQRKLSEKLDEYKKYYKKKSKLESLTKTKDFSVKMLTKIKNAQQKVTHLISIHQAIDQAEDAIANATDTALAEEKKKVIADVKERLKKIEAKKNPRILSIIFLKTRVQALTKALKPTKG